MDIRGPQYTQLREKVLAALHLDIEDGDIEVFSVFPTVERKGYRSQTSWAHPNPSYTSQPKVKVLVEVELEADASTRFADAVADVRDAEFAKDREMRQQRVDVARAELVRAQAKYDKAREETGEDLPC